MGDEFLGKSSHCLYVGRGPSHFDGNVASDCPAPLL
jgi:hypothetical protein